MWMLEGSLTRAFKRQMHDHDLNCIGEPRPRNVVAFAGGDGPVRLDRL